MTKNIRAICMLIVGLSTVSSGCGSENGPPAAHTTKSAQIVIERYKLPTLDFREAARSARFRKAVTQFARESAGQRVSVVGLPGAVGFRIPTARVDRDLWEWRATYRELGAYVFRYENAYGFEADAVLMLPTRDQWRVLDAAATDGVNYGLSHDDVVRGLHKIYARYPFELTEAGLDYVAGRFVRPVPDADRLAHELYRFCPDIVDHGTETVEALAVELRRSQELFCWWD